MTRLPHAWVLLLLLSGTALAQGRVEDIPAHWTAKGLRRIAVLDVAASSMLGEPGGRYGAARAVDGNRGTKWVASVAPGEAAPQWITLKLFGPQRASAVALFGEAPGNDGIRDARVQVSGTEPNTWTTVAAVKDAQSRSWLATFEPVKTSAVRVLVTRAGGPSTHTDAYEIELYGPPPAAGELKAYAAQRLEGCRAPVGHVGEAVQRLASATAPHPAELGQVSDQLARDLAEAAGRFARWDVLAPADRQELADSLERLEVRSGRLAQRLGGLKAWPAGMEATSSRSSGHCGCTTTSPRSPSRDASATEATKTSCSRRRGCSICRPTTEDGGGWVGCWRRRPQSVIRAPRRLAGRPPAATSRRASNRTTAPGCWPPATGSTTVSTTARCAT